MNRLSFLVIPIFVAACTPGPAIYTENLSRQQSQFNPEMVLTFETNSATLSQAQREELELFLQSWKNFDVSHVSIEGHADYRAAENYNLKLASRRIASVKDRVRSALAQTTSISSASFGEKAKKFETGTAAEVQQDRSVRVRLYLGDSGTLVLGYCPSILDVDPHANNGLEGLGCANRANRDQALALPLPAPNNLELGSPEPTNAAEAIVRYRTDQVKEFESDGGDIE